MNWRKKILSVKNWFLKKEPSALVIGNFKSQKDDYLSPKIYFEKVEVFSKTPPASTIGERHFVCVIYEDVPRWVLFKCPCGCGENISLSLQKQHNPYWRLQLNRTRRPTLAPSIWRNKGCMSHFVIKDGRIFWANDTGYAPSSIRGSQGKIFRV